MKLYICICKKYLILFLVNYMYISKNVDIKFSAHDTFME
jgi:hypothetical protein